MIVAAFPKYLLQTPARYNCKFGYHSFIDCGRAYLHHYDHAVIERDASLLQPVIFLAFLHSRNNWGNLTYPYIFSRKDGKHSCGILFHITLSDMPVPGTAYSEFLRVNYFLATHYVIHPLKVYLPEEYIGSLDFLPNMPNFSAETNTLELKTYLFDFAAIWKNHLIHRVWLRLPKEYCTVHQDKFLPIRQALLLPDLDELSELVLKLEYSWIYVT